MCFKRFGNLTGDSGDESDGAPDEDKAPTPSAKAVAQPAAKPSAKSVPWGMPRVFTINFTSFLRWMMFWSKISIKTLYLFDKNFLQDLRSPAREFPTPQPAYQLHEPWASHPQKLRTVLAVSNRSQISLRIFEKAGWNMLSEFTAKPPVVSLIYFLRDICTYLRVCYEIFWGILDLYWYPHDIDMISMFGASFATVVLPLSFRVPLRARAQAEMYRQGSRDYIRTYGRGFY